MKKLTHDQVDKEVMKIIEEQEKAGENEGRTAGRGLIDRLKAVKERRQTGGAG